MPFKFFFSKNYSKEFQDLPENLQILAGMKLEIFLENPFDHSLDTHKLHGQMKKYYSFSVNYKYRIIFSIEGSDITVKSIGGHSKYNRFR